MSIQAQHTFYSAVTKPPKGLDALSRFLNLMLTDTLGAMDSISVKPSDNGKIIQFQFVGKIYTFTMHNPSSTEGTRISHKESSVYLTEPYEILLWLTSRQ